MVEMNPAVAIPATALSTVSAASGLLAQDVMDGTEPSTLTTGAVFAVGAGVIGALWRAWRNDQASANRDRRAADEQIQAELVRLRRRVDQLTDRLVANGGTLPPEYEP